MVKVDLSDLDRAHVVVMRDLRRIRGAFSEAGREAANASRRNHAYRNRTGETQDKTQSKTEVHGSDVFTVVEIDVPHASYLMAGGRQDRPSSLTQLEEAVDEMEKRLDYFTDGLGDV